MPDKQWQIVLAGTGGQGLILAGVLLAKAAVREGNNVVQTQSYGTQSRGGYSQAEVQISKNEIYFPKCDNPDLVLALSQTAYDRFSAKVTEECIIVFDQDSVKSSGRRHDAGFPFTALALDLGNERVINTLALGVILNFFPVVSKESVVIELENELSAKVLALNLKALDLGYSLQMGSK